MVQTAWAATHTNNTYLSAFYRRIQVRKGAPKAAMAHHIRSGSSDGLTRGERPGCDFESVLQEAWSSGP
jgi:hypothetical protein